MNIQSMSHEQIEQEVFLIILDMIDEHKPTNDNQAGIQLTIFDIIDKSEDQMIEISNCEKHNINISKIRTILEIIEDKFEIPYIPDEDDDIEKLKTIEDIISQMLYCASDEYINQCLEDQLCFDPPEESEWEFDIDSISNLIVGVVSRNLGISRFDLNLDKKLIEDLGLSTAIFHGILLKIGLHLELSDYWNKTTNDLISIVC
ncbi:MAG: hypothetical protein PHH83_01290 [Patescibacteria group bacterium]|nr:hypothetical protein [Patescibacteria group bacterium]